MAYLIGHDRVPGGVNGGGLRVEGQTKPNDAGPPSGSPPSTLDPQPAAQRLLARRKALTDPIDESRRAAMALFAPQVADLETAERDVKRAIGVYLDVQEQERRRLQADAEAKARKERERLQAQAQAAEKAGKVERSEVLAERAAQVVAPVVVTAPPRVAGQSVRKAWKFEIVDAQAIPREYLVPDESKIRKVVAALGADAVIAGVRVYAETVIASRSI